MSRCCCCCVNETTTTHTSHLIPSSLSLSFYYIWFASHWFAGASQSSQNRNKAEFSVCVFVCVSTRPENVSKAVCFYCPLFFFFFWVYSHRENIPYFLLQTSTVGSLSFYLPKPQLLSDFVQMAFFFLVGWTAAVAAAAEKKI